jgi:hypothetical protein
LLRRPYTYTKASRHIIITHLKFKSVVARLARKHCFDLNQRFVAINQVKSVSKLQRKRVLLSCKLACLKTYKYKRFGRAGWLSSINGRSYYDCRFRPTKEWGGVKLTNSTSIIREIWRWTFKRALPRTCATSILAGVLNWQGRTVSYVRINLLSCKRCS